MFRIREKAALMAAGGVGYTLIEILWRGQSHWTMTVTGGVCFTEIYRLCGKMKKAPRWVKCAMGGLMITTIEFLVGCLVNLRLQWNVWDYSKRFLHLKGQICPLYSCLWVLLCLPVTVLCDTLREGHLPSFKRAALKR